MIESKKNVNIFLMMNQMIKNNFQEYFMNEYELLVSEVQKKHQLLKQICFKILDAMDCTVMVEFILKNR